MLLAPEIGLDSSILTLLVFYAFGAAAVGAFDSLPLTYLGGVGIGVVTSLLTKYVSLRGPIGALPSTLPFLVLFVVLLVIPKRRLLERGGDVVRRAIPPLRLAQRTQWVATAVGIVALIVVPHIVGSKITIYTQALVYVVLFASLNLLVRTSGQISLCQMTFAAVGGATFAHAIKAGLPWPAAVLAGGLIAIPVGALVAIPAIRLSGVYLAISTFGFAVLVQQLAFRWAIMFGSPAKAPLPAPRPHVSWLHTQADTGYYYVVLVVMALAWALVVGVRRGRLGRLLRGLAEAPVAVDANGANTNLTRLYVFCISAFLAGIAGAVIVPITGSTTPASFDFSISLLIVAVLFMAGRYPILGAFVAATLYVVVPGYITNSTTLSYMPVVFGAGAVIAAMAGGWPVVDRLRASKRSRERLVRSPVKARRAVLAETAP
jgi:ABC-type branched-subunit amino acid transport system permease subunit